MKKKMKIYINKQKQIQNFSKYDNSIVIMLNITAQLL